MDKPPEGYVQVEADGSPLPYLSYSRVSRYLLCPEQYRLYYVEGLRPRLPSASLEFGQTVHRALAAHFTAGKDSVAVFAERWAGFEKTGLRYTYRESWPTLNERGQTLLRKFVEDEAPRIANVAACEKPFELTISSLDVPFVGVIDLVADVDGKRTVVDFKTASQKFQDHEVALSDQLTAYHLATPGVTEYALCVLVKTKEPRIDWYRAERRGEDLVAFLDKARLVGQAIQSTAFYRRPGKWCSYCDYLPICMDGKMEGGEGEAEVPF